MPAEAVEKRARATKESADFDKWVDWTAKQRMALEVSVRHKHTFYGGSCGGGKSYMLRWSQVRWLIDWYCRYGLKGIQVGLFCQTYATLHDRQITRIKAELPPWLGTYHETAHELRLRPEYGSGIVCLRNLDDTGKYRSAEFARMAFDELTETTEDDYDFLTGTRLRWAGLPVEEWGSASGSNPGGIGHAWVKRRWITREFLPNEDPSQYAFIPARVSDNPHLPPGYEEQLRGLSPEMRAAYLEGNWDMFSGQVFSEWRPAVHVIQPFEIPRQWTRFRSVDYGYTAPSAVGWWAVDPDTSTMYLYRELHETELGPAQLAQAIKDLTPADEGNLYTVGDPSLFKTDEQTGQSNAMVMATNGVGISPANNDRLGGWRLLHDYLRVFDEPQDDGSLKQNTRLKVFNTCPNFIRTFPAMVHSKTRPEDVDTKCDDHQGDQARYACLSRPGLKLHLTTEETDAKREAARKERFEREFPGRAEKTGPSMGW